jgi:hypothetical protein
MPSPRLATLILPFAILGSASLSATDQPEIKFVGTATQVVLKGECQGMDRDIYPLEGKAGQTLKVTVKNRLKLVLFRLQMPGTVEKYLPKAGEEDDATTWSGKLPVDGKYLIVVGAMKGADSRYTLQVNLSK